MLRCSFIACANVWAHFYRHRSPSRAVIHTRAHKYTLCAPKDTNVRGRLDGYAVECPPKQWGRVGELLQQSTDRSTLITSAATVVVFVCGLHATEGDRRMVSRQSIENKIVTDSAEAATADSTEQCFIFMDQLPQLLVQSDTQVVRSDDQV